MSTNSDEVDGKWEQVKGKTKETVGEVIDDEQMEAEGKAQNAKGEAQETWGKFKGGVEDAADAVKDAVTGDDN